MENWQPQSMDLPQNIRHYLAKKNVCQKLLSKYLPGGKPNFSRVTSLIAAKKDKLYICQLTKPLMKSSRRY